MSPDAGRCRQKLQGVYYSRKLNARSEYWTTKLKTWQTSEIEAYKTIVATEEELKVLAGKICISYIHFFDPFIYFDWKLDSKYFMLHSEYEINVPAKVKKHIAEDIKNKVKFHLKV